MRRAAPAVLAGVLVAVSAGCTGDGAPEIHAAMTATPAAAVVDQALTVTVTGLPPGTRTTVTAAATDGEGTRWSSSAEFEATADGRVSLAQPALGGSYSGGNAMGLLESMTPGDTDKNYFVPPRTDFDVTLQAEVDGRSVATATVRRLNPNSAGITSRQLRPTAAGVHGTVFLPRDTSRRRPALLVFGGSGGGERRAYDAALLATHGYPTLSLAYFAAPGLPATLEDVPLEYFGRALRILRTQPGVDPRRVLVMGDSRGGEAALLLGSYFPAEVNGVVAGVPSNAVRGGFPEGDSAWTLGGRRLPAGEVIPVERIRGPVLLSCGGKDLAWSSCLMTQAVVDRLAEHRFRYPVTDLRFPDAGHGAGRLTTYYTSVTDDALIQSGGTVATAQKALVDGQAALLRFLAAR